MSQSKQEIIKWYIYDPLDYQRAIGATLSPNRCAFSCRYTKQWGGKQCSRKPKETIEGYGWCRQHAERIRRRLNGR